ncbi:MAG: patatin-like phospholipase family protein [Clostridia bacterium]|nr:patatin-like phospholipase family protein [Clostridia bacterium]
MKKLSQKTLALALGGGSALGFAHIGFLQVLEEKGIKVNAIAGTSMGSLIGAFYAFGYSGKELEEIALEKFHIGQFITDINPLTFIRRGFISGKRLAIAFNKFLENKNIEDLQMPYVAIAADMMRGEIYKFSKGPVSEAIRASISIPGVFTPIKKDDMLLIDGGVIDNVPSDAAKDFGMDVTISVDVLGDYNMKKVPKTITGMLVASYSLIQQEYYKYKPSFADLKVKMDLDGVSVTSFDKPSIKKAILIGRKYAEKHLEQIKKLIY